MPPTRDIANHQSAPSSTDIDHRTTSSDLANVADQAFARSGAAQAIAAARNAWGAPSKWQTIKHRSIEDERAILCNISREIERQARFQSALGAIRLHHAIAACQAGLTLQRELDAFVLEQLEVQEELIEKGGTVDDPTALERAKLESADIQLKLDCQLRKLRNELSLLIGPETACSYTSELVTTPTPTLEEPCDLQSLALANRIELKLTRYLRHHVDRLGKDGLKQASELLKLPADLIAPWEPKHALPGLANKEASDSLHRKRVAAIDAWIQSREQKIRVEVANAIEVKDAAAKRWQLAIAQSNSWQDRYERLQALSEFRGNLAQQVQAKLETFRARSIEIERWLEWLDADCDLQQAIGRIGFWRDTTNPNVTSINATITAE